MRDVHEILYLTGLAPPDVEALLDYGLGKGWETSRDGDSDGMLYNGPLNEYSLRRHSRAAVCEDIDRHRRGSITLWSEGIDFSLEFHRERPLDAGDVVLSVDRVHFRRDAEQTTRTIVQAATAVYEFLKPAFAFSYLPVDADFDTAVSEISVESDGIPDVFWVTFLPPETVDRIGRESVRSATTWMTEFLDDGSAVLVATSDPLDYTPAVKRRLRSELGLPQE